MTTTQTEPTAADLLTLRDAYAAYLKGDATRQQMWDAVVAKARATGADCGRDAMLAQYEERRAWRAVQEAFVRATAYVNDPSRTPLVNDRMVARLLKTDTTTEPDR